MSNAMRRKVKELDPYLKGRIGEALIQLQELKKPSNLPGTSRVYYTGNWAKDVYDNFTDKQAATIFAKVAKMKEGLSLSQQKLPTFKDEEGQEWSGYDYIARKL
tara:strand:+ start:179 stop:490 length:312 start_codon:yes stop_codon:yes gene_type:complete